MEVAYAIVAVGVAVMLAISARQKLVRDPRAVEIIGDVVVVPLRLFPALALLEITGCVGLLVGIGIESLGVAAGIGLVCYFLVAIASHVRARDFVADHLFPAVLMLAVSVTALVLRLAA